MTTIGAEGFFWAFVGQDKPCPHLQKLLVGFNPFYDEGVLELTRGIKAGAFQQLRHLHIKEVGMKLKGFKALMETILANPGCPRLEVLEMSTNNLCIDGIVYLSECIKTKGALQHLRELTMVDVGVTMDGAKALFQALGDRHVLPKLDKLDLGERYADIGLDYQEDNEVVVNHGVMERLTKELYTKRRGEGGSQVRVFWRIQEFLWM